MELSSEQLKGVFDAEKAAIAASPLASYIGASPHRYTARPIPSHTLPLIHFTPPCHNRHAISDTWKSAMERASIPNISTQIHVPRDVSCPQTPTPNPETPNPETQTFRRRSTYRGTSPVSLGSPSPELGSRPGRSIDQVGSIVPHSPIVSQPRFLPDDLEPDNDSQAQPKSRNPEMSPILKRTQPVRGGVSPIRASERSLSPVGGQRFGSDTLQMFGKSASNTQQSASETFTTDASSATSGSLVRSYRKKPTGSLAMASNADSVRSGYRRNTGYM
jgi:hypothetical protein